MFYKNKVLLIHKNSLIKERITNYLRENEYGVIVAHNIDNIINLTEGMQPDIIVWGETLTAKAKNVLMDLKNHEQHKSIPIIALIADIELFDRLEIEKYGIFDILDTMPNLSELKLKIRLNINNARQLNHYRHEIERQRDISDVQFDLFRLNDFNHICELVSDHIYELYRPDILISVISNNETDEIEYKRLFLREQDSSYNAHPILDVPIWQDYFLSSNQADSQKIKNKNLLNIISSTNLNARHFYQFPVIAGNTSWGVFILGLDERISNQAFGEITILSGSLGLRLNNLSTKGESKARKRQDD
ncbi:MAG: hypothetical protein GF313_17190, partial [Caldithrix sp.]|nr:hypothetical protein [Caldithrix sp.]